MLGDSGGREGHLWVRFCQEVGEDSLGTGRLSNLGGGRRENEVKKL